ncbi:hypothetical protein [Tenacibaculum finnmarkense]|uniref:hypothetical protein n=1 Tax=Tenacibaculum finnmarkense TaxID=2781243 RepID=UPI001EFA7373|nr:hypothetical protein [Tenacibaculum finnmarkense]MCG8208844.1 hypothetical protein [Tenacibaculum finnmarkense genomovar finnmarkense]MCG8224415.1 hypothetical protein [Tenacibaculum finnmarkense genomovar finnmarkense]MCG8714000.1 hypothetical protein [Tenacibaculum finnmarkense]MCG8737068.1 hypothetical protein [Tenacibaculum finnmarkense]MCG8766174.1 hypothetical protein [Tenacibaculum finnmarkense]
MSEQRKIELKQLEFFNKYRVDLLKKYLENEDKTGFAQVYVTPEFEIFKSGISFVECSDFDKKDFVLIDDPEEFNFSSQVKSEVQEAFYTYYRIFWQHNHKFWNVKRLLIKGIRKAENS